MSEKQINFRKEYRSANRRLVQRIPSRRVIYAIGFTAMYIYVQNIGNVVWWEWLTIPVVILVCNMFEWFLHTHIMHRPITVKGLRPIYVRHTLNHHQFFSDSGHAFPRPERLARDIFPPYALVVFILMSAPGA